LTRVLFSEAIFCSLFFTFHLKRAEIELGSLCKNGRRGTEVMLVLLSGGFVQKKTRRKKKKKANLFLIPFIGRSEKRLKRDVDQDITPDTPVTSETPEAVCASLRRTPTVPLVDALSCCPQCWRNTTLEKLRTCGCCERLFHDDCLEEVVCSVCVSLRVCTRLYGGTIVCGSNKRQVAVDVGGLCALLSSREQTEVFVRNCMAVTSDFALNTSAQVLNDTACVAWDGDREENQDVGFFSSGDVAIKLFSVFDGHGVGGQVAAHFGADDLIRRAVFHRMCLMDPHDGVEVQDSLKKAFAETQKALLDLLLARKLECGSTVVLAQVVGSSLVVANVGDSRAVLIRQENEEWTPLPLSVDHSFSRLDECKRIQETSKGEIVVGAGDMMRVIPG
jgi:hypothetical protein